MSNDPPTSAGAGEPPPASPRQPSLAEQISPDDWRLYYLMRDLSDEDRGRVIAFAELLYNLRQARNWAERR